MKKDEFCLRVLRYGEEHQEGFTLNELREDLDLSDLEFRFLQNEASGADLFAWSSKYRDGTTVRGRDNQIVILSFEARFKLLEYLELQEARQSGRKATFLAIVAIVISIFVGLYQIIVPQQVKVVDVKVSEEISVLVSDNSTLDHMGDTDGKSQ